MWLYQALPLHPSSGTRVCVRTRVRLAAADVRCAQRPHPFQGACTQMPPISAIRAPFFLQQHQHWVGGIKFFSNYL